VGGIDLGVWGFSWGLEAANGVEGRAARRLHMRCAAFIATLSSGVLMSCSNVKCQIIIIIFISIIIYYNLIFIYIFFYIYCYI
jgi:hypothetical protein